MLKLNYKVYISESEAVENTPPIYITNQDIGDGKPVSVNEADGKLEYVHSVSNPGRVYM